MSNLIPTQTRHELARSIYRDIITGKDLYYVFLGKSFDENDNPVDTRNYIADIHKNILLAKRVVPGPNDVVYMIQRKNWESGFVYDEYSDYDILAYEESGELIIANFYVMTDDFKIFKCLKVGRDSQGNALPSTVKPTETSPEPEILGDGYIWKFMYEVPTLDRTKFLTNEYIPVRNVSDGVNFDVNGVINSIRIENPGEGYITPYLVIKGDGVVPFTITFNGESSVDVENDSIDFIGHTFITGDKVRYNSGGGTEIFPLTNNNVYYTIFYTDKKVRLAETLIDAENGNYIELTPGEGLTHSLTPVGTTADVNITPGGGISSITVTNSLRGYTYARPIMYDANTTPNDGSENYDGRITASINSRLIVGDGTRFTEQLLPGWTITDCPNEIIGIVDEILSDTELRLKTFANFNVSNCKYSAFSGGGFEGTVVLATETASFINQNVVLNSIPGAIYRVDVIDGGLGYDSATINIIGDGVGGNIIVDSTTDIDEDGTIKQVQIENYGQHYNYARLEITGLPITPAIIRAHVGPPRGHGFNIAQELFAHSLCISTTISTNNPDLFVGNDYRQLGIVKNLKLYNDIQDVDIGLFDKDSGTATFIITVPENEYLEYDIDDVIIASTGGVYQVVSKIFDARTEQYKIYLLYIEGSEVIDTTTTFTNENSQLENLICLHVRPPDFDKNTGTIIYVNEFSPITRTVEQIETIKILLHF
jgi:hypothetical protein